MGFVCNVTGFQMKKIRLFRIESGRGGLFLEIRITNDGNDYARQARISSNVKAVKGNLERKTRFEGP